MELTEEKIVEIYDRILKQDDLFGIKEICRSDSYRKSFGLMGYTGAYRALAAEYTEKYGYDTFNEFLKRTSGLIAEYKPMKIHDPFTAVKKSEAIAKLEELDKDGDTEQIDFSDAIKAVEDSFGTAN